MRLNQQKIIAICDQVITWSIYATLTLVPICFAFRQENFNIFELNKLVVFKTAISLAFLAWLLKLSLERRLKIFFDFHIFIPLLLLLIYVVVNTCLAIDPWQSFFGNYMRQQGIMSLLYYWLWFIILLFHLHDKRQIQSNLIAVIIGLIPVLIYCFMQKFGLDPLKWSEPGTGRSFASLGQPNFLAYYLDLSIFLSLAYWYFLSKFWQKIAWTILLVVELIALIFTDSRGGLLALIAGIIILVTLRLWNLGKQKALVIFFALSLSLILVTHFSINNLVARGLITNNTLIRYSAAFSQVSGSSQVRLFYWQAAWQDFKTTTWSHRFFGYGKEGQRSVYVKYYRPNWGLHEKLNSYPDRAHNLIIDIYLEFGLFGLLLFAYFSGLIAFKALRVYLQSSLDDGRLKFVPYLLAALTAYFVSNLFGFPLTTHYLYYYFILALLWYLGSKQEERLISLPVSRLFCYLVAAVITIFNIFLLWQFTYKYFIADSYFMKAKVAEANLDCSGVITNVNLASSWQPLDPYYQEQLLFMYNNCIPLLPVSARKQLMSDLLSHLAQTDERNYDYDLTLSTAHTYSLLGSYFDKKYYNQAEHYYQLLISLNPYILSAYQDYGRMEIWSGNYEKAKLILRQGIAHSPLQINNYGQFGYQHLIDSQTYYLLELIADCDYHQKNFKEALATYLDIESKALVSVDLYKNIADSYYQLHDYPQTEIYLKKSLALVPTDVNINLSLASFYADRSNISEARRLTELVLKLAPNNEDALVLLARLKSLSK